MDHNKEFETLIKKDRDLHLSRSWRQSLAISKRSRKIPPPPNYHARLYDRMMKAGVRDIHESGDPHVKRLYKDESIKVYDFFADEFFGIEKTISQIVRYFHAASLKGEESRQVLYLMGPVGSEKALWSRNCTGAWKKAIPSMPSKAAQCLKSRFI